MTALSQLPGTEESNDMWRTLVKKFDSTDSIVSLVLGLAVVLVVGITIVNYVKSKTQHAASTTQTANEKTAPTPSLPAKHAVKEGESLWTIAEIYYKSGYNWVDIRDANTLVNPDLIEAGLTLTIPDVPAKIVGTPAISAASISEKPKDTSYTVVKGDDLWNIALREYGSGYKWVDIATANKLANPGIIHPGNVLVMP